MKKFTLVPSTLLGFLILTVGLTSCSKKYGCYYSDTTELKTRYDDTACLGYSSCADTISPDQTKVAFTEQDVAIKVIALE